MGAPFVARAQQAEFTDKYAEHLSLTHPMNTRAREMADQIKAETNGRVEINIFPSSQLGSDTDTLSQLRSGGVEFFTLSGLILSTLVPAASINGIGFAFPDYASVWKAMDGELCAYVRQQIAEVGLVAMEKIWDNGFRQTTASTKPINTPDDLRAMKIRVPPSPLWISMYKAFEAARRPINFNEVYTALQTKVVDGQENPLAIVATAKLYEVQKYCWLTNHMGRILVPGEPRRLGAAAAGSAHHRGQAHQCRRREGTRGRVQIERLAARGTRRQGNGIQPTRTRPVPGEAAQGRILCRMEGQVRRRGVGQSREVHR